jgi:ribose transport system ATP-binding protein
MRAMTPPILEVVRASKSFGAVKALQDVSLQLHAGEVVCLIGENGAGKSTLMKLLAGVHRPDQGEVRIVGSAVQFANPRAALDAGVALIHQELSLCENLTVAGAVYLGRELRNGPFLRQRAMEDGARAAMQRVGLEVGPTRLVSSLSPGQRQLLEIARALERNARVLIFDEPTSSLADAETQRLFALVRELKASGVAIVWITHRMNEALELADRVIALRDGKNAGEIEGAHATHDRMVAMMVGREVEHRQRTTRAFGDVVLSARGVRTKAWPQAAVDLSLRAGEIVGIAGLLGSGRSELLRALFGIDPLLAGEVRCGDTLLHAHGPLDAARAGLVLVPEDRKLQGVVLGMNVRENLSLPNLRARGVWIDSAWEHQVARDSIEQLGIATPNGEQIVSALSGGNQQKVAIGKWLLAKPRALLLDEPTRGVDVAARAEIYARIEALAEQGMATLFVSSELPEVIALADRCLVMHEGRIAGELQRAEMTEEAILRLATGSSVA